MVTKALFEAAGLMQTTDPFRVAIRERVLFGVLLLDTKYPKWRWVLRASRVDIRYADTDPLGLLYPGYLTGLDKLGIGQRDAHRWGFTPVDGGDSAEILALNDYWNFLKDWHPDEEAA